MPVAEDELAEAISVFPEHEERNHSDESDSNYGNPLIAPASDIAEGIARRGAACRAAAAAASASAH